METQQTETQEVKETKEAQQAQQPEKQVPRIEYLFKGLEGDLRRNFEKDGSIIPVVIFIYGQRNRSIIVSGPRVTEGDVDELKLLMTTIAKMDKPSEIFYVVEGQFILRSKTEGSEKNSTLIETKSLKSIIVYGFSPEQTLVWVAPINDNGELGRFYRADILSANFISASDVFGGLDRQT